MPHRSEQYLLSLSAGSLHSARAHRAFETVWRSESVARLTGLRREHKSKRKHSESHAREDEGGSWREKGKASQSGRTDNDKVDRSMHDTNETVKLHCTATAKLPISVIVY